LQLLDVLTLNEDPRIGEVLTEFIRDAMSYFPDESWQGLNYLGNIDMEHGLEVRAREEERGAFTVRNLVGRLRELKRLLASRGLLLGLTRDPVVISYYNFEEDRLRRIVNLVRDYVASDVGMISLFGSDEESAVWISAHGLGHSRGLGHHPEPIDLMYVGLTEGSSLGRDGFCDDCLSRLREQLQGEDRISLDWQESSN
jgi:hypothetical protein